MVESEGEPAIRQEKIIPDGYIELIFHYGDPYKTNIAGVWQKQARHLFAAQIKNHFFLESTGHSGMVAIKLQPWAARLLFGVELSAFTDTVVPLLPEMHTRLSPLVELLTESTDFSDFTKKAETLFCQLAPLCEPNAAGEAAVRLIIESKGALSLKEIGERVAMSERGLERYFKQWIGVSPKFYSRIIRFAHIFELVAENRTNWAEISAQAGFYDQAHFIKNFRAFTGEEPSKYGFNEATMANFFLQK